MLPSVCDSVLSCSVVEIVIAARVDGWGDRLTSITLWLRAGRCSTAADVNWSDSWRTHSTAVTAASVFMLTLSTCII